MNVFEELARRLFRDRFPSHPFGRAPRADRETYLSLFETARSVSHPHIDKIERDLGHAVAKDWLDELALHTQVVIKDARLNYQHGRVVYSALRNFLEN